MAGADSEAVSPFRNLRCDLRLPLQDDALRDTVTKELSPEWHPFVEEWSNRDRECTLICARTNGNRMSMLIITSEESGELTLLQMNLNAKKASQWVETPIESAKR